jgi:hypothetical protein
VYLLEKNYEKLPIFQSLARQQNYENMFHDYLILNFSNPSLVPIYLKKIPSKLMFDIIFKRKYLYIDFNCAKFISFFKKFNINFEFIKPKYISNTKDFLKNKDGKVLGYVKNNTNQMYPGMGLFLDIMGNFNEPFSTTINATKKFFIINQYYKFKIIIYYNYLVIISKIKQKLSGNWDIR